MNASAASRWQTPNGTLYIAESVDTVMAEYCRNSANDVNAADPTGGAGLNPNNFAHFAGRPVGDPLPVRALFKVEASFDRVVDFRSQASRKALFDAGIDPDSPLADNYGPCPQIAQIGEQLGWQAIRAVSAADLTGTAVAIFRAFHPPPGTWEVEDVAVRPAVRTAYLTRYKAGERPTWLGQ